jgi:excisionase family DNA binding protein
MTNTGNSDYIKIAEAAHLLGVTQRWVYRRVLSGELPASKVGGLYFITRKDLQALIEAGRVTPGIEEIPAEEQSLPRKKCGFCYRLLEDDREIGGICEKDDCSEVICRKCWDLKIHFCTRHSPTREQRIQKAQEQKEAGLLPVFVKAGAARFSEMNFLNRIHERVKGYSTLIHPANGTAVTISSWEDILETGDDRIELMRLLGKVVLDSATTAQLPLNSWHHYTTNLKNKKSSPLEIHVQSVSRMDRMVRDGFDTEPLSADDLNEWIEKWIEVPAKTGSFRLVLLASITGWDESALSILMGSDGSYAFTHRSALLYLFDLNKNELIYNTSDDRACRYAELFHPVLANEELGEIAGAIKDLLGIHDSLTLADAQKSLRYAPEKIEKAFERITEDGDFVITEIKGLGTALVRRQAL